MISLQVIVYVHEYCLGKDLVIVGEQVVHEVADDSWHVRLKLQLLASAFLPNATFVIEDEIANLIDLVHILLVIFELDRLVFIKRLFDLACNAKLSVIVSVQLAAWVQEVKHPRPVHLL